MTLPLPLRARASKTAAPNESGRRRFSFAVAWMTAALAIPWMAVGCATDRPIAEHDDGPPDGGEWAGTGEWWTAPITTTDNSIPITDGTGDGNGDDGTDAGGGAESASRDSTKPPLSDEWAGEREWWLRGNPGTLSPESGLFEGEWPGAEEWWTRPPTADPARAATVAVVFEFSGNRHVSIGALSAAAADTLAELESTGATPSKADDAAHEMQVYYRQLGFHFATVGFELYSEAEPPARCRFIIDEGPRVRIAEIRLRGVSRFAPDELRRHFQVEVETATEGPVFVESRVRTAVAVVEERYREAGHLRVRIGLPEMQFLPPLPASPDAAPLDSRPDAVRITISIDEGHLYRIDGIEFVGPASSPDPPSPPSPPTATTDARAELPPHELRAAIRERLVAFLGQPYRRAEEARMSAAARELLQEFGYFAADVAITARIDDESGAVTILVRDEPGTIFVIGEVEFDTDALDHGFLRGLIPLKANSTQRYSLSREREAYRQILRTNIARSVKFEHRINLDGTLDYVIRVRETESVEVRPHIGWGSYEGLRGYLYFAETNAFGVARILSLAIGVSLRSEWIEGGFTDPFTLGGDWQWSVQGFYRRRKQPNFTRQDFGTVLSAETPLAPAWMMGLGYEFRDTRSFDVLDPNEPAGFDDRLGSFSLRLQFNDAFPLLVPQQGARLALRVEHYARWLGGTLEFTTVRLDSSAYFPLDADRRVVLAVGYTLEFFVLGPSTTELPIQERIFNGGGSSVRSFNEQGLRPWNSPDSKAGGQLRNVASIELRVPLIWAWSLDAAIFVDAGNLAESLDQAFDHWRICIGFGLRYITPIGPARLDFGFNPIPRFEEDRWAIHFSIGFPF